MQWLYGPEMAGADGERGAIPKQAREQPREQQLFFDNVNPATRLLEKRRQMYEVQDALENQKARFAKEEDQFRKKEEQLRDLQLQNQLVKFNKFLQDNEAKRQRSEKRAAEEAAQIKQKDEEILDLEKQLEDSRALCDKLEDEKNRNMKYEDSVLPSSLVEIWRLDDDDDDDDGDAQNQRHDSSLSSVQEASLLRARCPQAVTPVEDGNSRWGMHRAPLPGDLSHVLLMEMQKMVDKLQEKMSEELRREMRDMRELMFAEEPGQRPMFASKSISKVTTERSRPPRLPQGKSMHFNPHDEDEEFEEGGRGPESRNLSRVTSRPSANAEVHPEEKKSRQVSFAVSGKTTEQEIVEETRSLPQVPVLLGKDSEGALMEMQETPAAADSSDTEAAAERIPEIKSQAVDEDINLLCLPGQINKEPSNDASDVVHGETLHGCWAFGLGIQL
eukprot:s1212_g4.t4